MNLNSIKSLVSERSRMRKLEHFYSLYHGGTILDVGVSPLRQQNKMPQVNYFLRHRKFPLKLYTGIGIDDLSGLEALYPEATFITYDGNRMPFSDQQFDWVFSNAVIEHVNDQLMFLTELFRVAKRVFVTTPNKYFPIEVHTNQVLRHWHDPSFQRWLSRTGRYYEPIKLLSESALKRLVEQAGGDQARIYHNRFCGLTMTFTVVK
jgi:SAM-dependent methyltransferase